MAEIIMYRNDEAYEICELCPKNDIVKKYGIPLSHPFEKVPTVRLLCHFCVQDLTKQGIKPIEIE